MSDLSVAEWPAQPEPRLARAWPVLRRWLRPPSFFVRRRRWVFRLVDDTIPTDVVSGAGGFSASGMGAGSSAGFAISAGGVSAGLDAATCSLPADSAAGGGLIGGRGRHLRGARSPSLLRVARRAASPARAASFRYAARRPVPGRAPGRSAGKFLVGCAQQRRRAESEDQYRHRQHDRGEQKTKAREHGRQDSAEAGEREFLRRPLS